MEDCKRKPESEKKKPGRKKGHRGSYRRPPEPPEVTETVQVPLDCCPHCQGPVSDVKPLVQYIDDLIVVPRRLELTTYVGVCGRCGAVRRTPPKQVSTAAGAAGTHLGWRALSLAAVLNRQYGITARNVCDILDLLGLSLTPGGLVGALKRVADKLEPYMDQVREGLRQSAVVLHPAGVAVQKRLLKQRPHLLTFLISPEVDPTNKHSTGHNALRGVRTFEILKSLAATCRQQGRSFADLVGAVMNFGLPPPDPLFVKPAQP